VVQKARPFGHDKSPLSKGSTGDGYHAGQGTFASAIQYQVSRSGVPLVRRHSF